VIKMNWKKWSALLVSVLLLMSLAACGSNEAKVVKIGLVGPWTGPSADNGLSMRHGAELAVQNINANGGINGTKVELVAYDDASTPEESVNAVNKLITQDQVLAIVGAFNSACTLADKEVVNREKIPLLTPVSMSDAVITGDDYVFRNTLGNKEAGTAFDNLVDSKSGKWVFTDGTGSSKVAIMWENDDWGKGLSDSVIEASKFYHQEDRIVSNVAYNVGTTDFYPQLTKILEQKPDLIYCVSLAAEAIQIVKQARELGYKGLIMGEGGFNAESFDKTLGTKAYGCLFSTQWHPSFPYPMSQEFMKVYKAAYPDSEPDMFAAIAYEAVYIVKDSIERAPASDDLSTYRTSIRDAMNQLKDFDGVSGKISFTKHQCDRPEFLLQKRASGAVIVLPKAYAQDTIKR